MTDNISMSKPPADQNETIAFAGKIGEIIHTVQPDGRVFERYRRAPGTRLIIVSPEGKIVVTEERRQEVSGWDLRLPGGKVRDTLQAYHELLASGQDMLAAAGEAAAKEALEETGLVVHKPQFVAKATAGATVEWDLYYFLVTEYEQHPSGQALEHGEDITVTWMTPAEIRNAIAAGHMQEWRSVGVLLGVVLPKLEK
jgi:8-oxo-dGTP pyrophosphatase MutT (NUDIX family)